VRTPHPDPGLQPERTALAWTRTLISCLALMALLVRHLPDQPIRVVASAVLLGLIVTVATFSLKRRYLRQCHGIEVEQVRPAARTVALLGAGLACVAGGLAVSLVLY